MFQYTREAPVNDGFRQSWLRRTWLKCSGWDIVIHFAVSCHGNLTDQLVTAGEPSPLSSPVQWPVSTSPKSDAGLAHADNVSMDRSVDTLSDYDSVPRLVDTSPCINEH